VPGIGHFPCFMFNHLLREGSGNESSARGGRMITKEGDDFLGFKRARGRRGRLPCAVPFIQGFFGSEA
jgi:hypothetical protein